VSGATLQDRLDAVYEIGEGIGANRIGYSAEEDEAHRLVAAWMVEAGLETSVDADGNLLGRLRGVEPGLPEVWAGSHLDSVPHGGRFDGPLGVLGALEAVERLGRRRRTIGVVAFRDEERGCHGSHGFARRGPLPGTFLEIHHEQGARLAERDAPLALVTGVVGYKRVERIVEGRAGHAGTTPMEGRDDALVRAAAEVLRVRDTAASIPGAVATVGAIEAEPGAPNVIPGRVRYTIDARAPDGPRLEALLAALGVDAEGAIAPVSFAGAACDALRTALDRRGLPLVELFSGAGHDAGVLAGAGVDAAMLFVRAGHEGVSHSPDESCSPEDVALAVDVLADALVTLADAA
jgi:acetylornithine deacetylase/succinyl-diaminopimelate desuccinylase-like protein